MTKFKHFWIILWLISSPVHAEFRHFGDWTDKEKGLFTTYNILAYTDYKQTSIALKHPCQCYREANPLFGDYPSSQKLALTQVAFSGILYYWVGSGSPNYHNDVMWGAVVVRSYVVHQNSELGISWRVAF